MASVYSGADDNRYGTVAVKGQVEFGMQYNYKQGCLEIHVVQCKELAAVDAKRNRSDSYVKVWRAFPLFNGFCEILVLKAAGSGHDKAFIVIHLHLILNSFYAYAYGPSVVFIAR